MNTPIYDNLLERTKRHFAATADQPLPEGRYDTREQYYASGAAEAVINPLSDRDVLDVIAEIFDRVGRGEYPVDGYGNLAEALRGTLEFCLYQDVLPAEQAD